MAMGEEIGLRRERTEFANASRHSPVLLPCVAEKLQKGWKTRLYIDDYY